VTFFSGLVCVLCIRDKVGRGFDSIPTYGVHVFTSSLSVFRTIPLFQIIHSATKMALVPSDDAPMIDQMDPTSRKHATGTTNIASSFIQCWILFHSQQSVDQSKRVDRCLPRGVVPTTSQPHHVSASMIHDIGPRCNRSNCMQAVVSATWSCTAMLVLFTANMDLDGEVDAPTNRRHI
jgi:hypothetical protein